MSFVTYDPLTGDVKGVYHAPDDDRPLYEKDGLKTLPYQGPWNRRLKVVGGGVTVPAAEDSMETKFQKGRILRQSDWVVQRHRDQMDLVDAKQPVGGFKLTTQQFIDLQKYRQAVRDHLTNDPWPTPPIWLNGVIQP